MINVKFEAEYDQWVEDGTNATCPDNVLTDPKLLKKILRLKEEASKIINDFNGVKTVPNNAGGNSTSVNGRPSEYYER